VVCKLAEKLSLGYLRTFNVALMLLLLHFWHRVSELMARLQILLRLPSHMKHTEIFI